MHYEETFLLVPSLLTLWPWSWTFASLWGHTSQWAMLSTENSCYIPYHVLFSWQILIYANLTTIMIYSSIMTLSLTYRDDFDFKIFTIRQWPIIAIWVFFMTMACVKYMYIYSLLLKIYVLWHTHNSYFIETRSTQDLWELD
jgi:hypothetical protein